MKTISFYPMNVLIKGTQEAIHKALAVSGIPHYKLDAHLTFDPDRPDKEDRTLKKAGVIFDMFNEAYTTTDKMPMCSMKDVKFIMLACGGTPTNNNGTYAIYKDFGEIVPSVIWQFEKYKNPYIEEFEAQYDILEKLWQTFLNKEWKISYFDYGGGMPDSFQFSGKKARELVEKWKDDVRFQLDNAGHIIEQKAEAKRESKKERLPLDVPESLDGIMVEKSIIDLGSYKFSYDAIDEAPENVAAGLPDVRNVTEMLGSFKVSVHLTLTDKKIAEMMTDTSLIWFDPRDYGQKFTQWKSSYSGGNFLGNEHEVKVLTYMQFVRRAELFREMMKACCNKAVMKAIVEAYPKKRNGFFYPRRVLTIGWLYAVGDLHASFMGQDDVQGVLYQLYAQADNEKELDITARLHCPRLYEIEGYNLIAEKKDMFVLTNLFSSSVRHRE